MLNEEFSRLFSALEDDCCRSVALLKMQRFVSREIAEKIDRSVSAVERCLRLVRKKWQREEGR
jgi:DNA-directed RNA polymerase specialized sigma24 family protein